MKDEFRAAKKRMEELGWFWQTNLSLHRIEFRKGDMLITCNRKEVTSYRKKEGWVYDPPFIDTRFLRKQMVDELTGEHWNPHCGASPNDLRAIADLMEAAESEAESDV